jgi:ABC-2 type transport system ATP-binding protein
VGTGATLQDVSKRYSRRGPWVLRGVSVEIRGGTLTSIVGANGSGKSTLLRIAAGLVSPSGGTTHIPERIGYLPERQPARLKFTGAEYLAGMGRIKGLPATAARAKADELLGRLGLQPGAEAPWEILSKGNRQKVLIAQAFLAPSDLVVLDEPASGLDDVARGVLDDLVGEALSGGAAVLATVHGSGGARGADTSWRLHGANLVEVVSPAVGTGVRKRIVLVAPPAGPTPAVIDLSDVEHVRSEESGRRLELRVAAETGDELLRHALAFGWSVESVTLVDRRES